jgi:hypothetical protein
MGWNINLTSDKPLTELLVAFAVQELPGPLKAGFGKQPWGWSLAVDVRLRDEHTLGLSGSYAMSGKDAQAAAQAFAKILRIWGHAVEIGEMH